MYTTYNVPLPKVVAYDDGCHLLKFLKNRADPCGGNYGYSKFAHWLLTFVLIVVDRFHFPNHVDEKFCKVHCDPFKCKKLGPRTNTEAAEQVRRRAPRATACPLWLTRAARVRRRASRGSRGVSTSSAR